MKSKITLLLGVFVVGVLVSCTHGQEESFDAFAKKMSSKLASENSPNLKGAPAIITAEQNSNDIIIFEAGADWSLSKSELWRWNPNEAKIMPKKYAKWFRFIDECKPVLGTSHILATASHGGVALVRVSDKAVVFFAHAGKNPHSACLLPDGNVVSVSSTDNKMRLFNRANYKQGTPCEDFEEYFLDFGHGVVWDKTQQILWALGRFELVGYKYNFNKNKPQLEKLCSYPLTELGKVGHDLYPVPETKYLFFTGNKGVGLFDTQTRTFRDIAQVEHIKSVSYAKNIDCIIYQKPKQRWWSNSIVCADKNFTNIGTYPNGKFYKARWFIPNKFSEF